MKNKLTALFFGSSLTRDTLFFGTATLAERLISFFLIPLLTKTLPQELYGVWSQIVVTVGLLTPIILVGFQTTIVRFLAAKEDVIGMSTLFHALLSVVLANSVLVIIITIAFNSTLSQLMFGDIQFAPFVGLFGFILLAEVLFEMVIAFLRAQNKIRIISMYYFIKSIARIGVLTFVIIVLGSGLSQALVLSIILQFALIAYMYIKDILNKVGFSFSLQHIPWKEILLFSLPLIPYASATWSNNFADRYLILHLLGLTKVSIYAVAYSLSASVGILYAILGFTLYPHLAALWNNGDKNGAADTLSKATAYYLYLSIPVVSLLTLLGSHLVKILSTADYFTSWPIFFWLSGGIALFGVYSLHVYVLMLADKTVLSLIMMIVALFSNIILNLLLIPQWGISGAAIATCLSNSVLAFWSVVISPRFLPYRFPWVIMIKSVLISLGVSTLLLIVKISIHTLSDLWIFAIIATLAVIVYGLLYLSGKKPLLLYLERNL